MFTIFLRTIKDRKWTIIIYSITVVIFLWMYVALFPSFSESFEQMQGFMESFPKGLMEAFGFDAKTFFTFEGYMGSEQFTLVWPIMILAFSISFSGWAFSGEMERGTIETLLSQPISRVKLFFAKYFAGIFSLVIFIICSILPIFLMCKIYDISMNSENFVKAGFLGLALGLAIYSISVFFSVLFSEKGRANFLPAGIFIIMYVMNIIAELKDNLVDLRYFSFFYYYNPSKLLVYGEFDKWTWLIFGGVFVIFTLLAAIRFKNRDIAV